MFIVKTWSNIRTSQTQNQINSHSIPRLDPIDSKSSNSLFSFDEKLIGHYCIKDYIYSDIHKYLPKPFMSAPSTANIFQVFHITVISVVYLSCLVRSLTNSTQGLPEETEDAPQLNTVIAQQLEIRREIYDTS